MVSHSNYYSVPVDAYDQRYLKFEFDNQLYKYTCFPNGLAPCPRKFTKLLKPVYCHLREKGHLSSGYIDDSYLQGDIYQDCLANVVDTVKLFDKLGFVVHAEKSVFTQSSYYIPGFYPRLQKYDNSAYN